MTVTVPLDHTSALHTRAGDLASAAGPATLSLRKWWRPAEGVNGETPDDVLAPLVGMTWASSPEPLSLCFWGQAA